MTIQRWLAENIAILAGAGVTSARLDCVILLEDITGRDRANLLAHPEDELTDDQLGILRAKIAERYKHVPLAYIRRKVPFFGREFMVNKHVLVPRPETEVMIEMFKDLPHSTVHATHVWDVGTGSGAIGISAALEAPDTAVTLSDVDAEALEVAHHNAKTLGAPVTTVQADLLDGLPAGTVNIILTNLPYVPDKLQINKAATHEPKLALFAGEDGLDLYRRFWEQLTIWQDKPTYVLTESLPVQHAKLAALAKNAGYTLARTQGFIQQFNLR